MSGTFSFLQRPSTLEGFTQIISNDRGHILSGIPRSSKSPWGEFVGTWDMEKAPLRTKTMKTTAMSTDVQNAAEVTEEKVRTPSPKQDVAPEKARTPTPQQEAMRTPTPKEVQERASSRPPSQDNQVKKSPSPAIKVKTPDPPASPAKSPIQNESSPKKQVVLSEPV